MERNQNAEAAGQPCQADGGKPAELDILKPWFLCPTPSTTTSRYNPKSSNTHPPKSRVDQGLARGFAITCVPLRRAFRRG